MGKNNVRKNLNRATGRVDKAQNKVIKSIDTRVKNLEASVEKKYSYYASGGIAIQGWSGTTTLSRSQNIYPIRVGSQPGLGDDNERIGDAVSVKSLNLSYTVYLANGAATSADAFNRVRCVLFWDKDPVVTNSAGTYQSDVPEWQQMFQTPNLQTSLGSPLVIISQYDHDKRHRFEFLHDKVHSLASNGNVSTAIGMGPRAITGVERKSHSYKIGKKIRYAAGGSIPINRQLYLGFISDSGFPSHPYVDFSLVVNYEDA